MLSTVSEAEFVTLRTALDVSDSVLSKHISALAEAGSVRSRKSVRRTAYDLDHLDPCRQPGPARARCGAA